MTPAKQETYKNRLQIIIEPESLAKVTQGRVREGERLRECKDCFEVFTFEPLCAQCRSQQYREVEDR